MSRALYAVKNERCRFEAAPPRWYLDQVRFAHYGAGGIAEADRI